MKDFFFIFVISLCLNQISFAEIWQVGPSQQYKMPSEIVNLVHDGDKIFINPGVYEQDACKWKNKDLSFIGTGTGPWKVVIKYTGNIPNGKGIWVFENPGDNDNIYIENIIFDGAQVSDDDGGNGAAIRFQAKNLEVYNCSFRNCQNGILEGHGSVIGSNVKIHYSDFFNNGYQDQNNPEHSGYEHNIYISASTDTLLLENNFFHQPRGQGNSIKTRALNAFILYNYIDEEDAGFGSYEINIAQGGNNIIIGNIIIQGSNGANHAIIGYDEASNPLEDFYFINNTVINKFKGNNKYFNISPSSGINTFKIYNNIFATVPGSSNTFIAGNEPTALDTSNNYFIENYLTAGFNDTENGDYSLNKESTNFLDKGTDAGTSASGFSLTPTYMYQNYYNLLFGRTIYGAAIDVGAYEYIFVSGVHQNNVIQLNTFPNPSTGTFEIKLDNIINYTIELTDITGNKIEYQKELIDNNRLQLILKNNKSGIYFVKISINGKSYFGRVIVL